MRLFSPCAKISEADDAQNEDLVRVKNAELVRLGYPPVCKVATAEPRGIMRSSRHHRLILSLYRRGMDVRRIRMFLRKRNIANYSILTLSRVIERLASRTA